MKHFKIFLLVLPLFAFTTMHKFYVSVTQVEYVKEKQSLQIITRIFVDDLEALLRERYDKNITLEDSEDETQIDFYIDKYLKEKIQIHINDKQEDFIFIGKEYEEDIVYCYLEITNVKGINSFEISNQVFFDLYEEQQNIIKAKINSKNKSFMLTSNNTSRVLNFN
jgi:Domain of unknown function (DUF6702)